MLRILAVLRVFLFHYIIAVWNLSLEGILSKNKSLPMKEIKDLDHKELSLATQLLIKIALALVSAKWRRVFLCIHRAKPVRMFQVKSILWRDVHIPQKIAQLPQNHNMAKAHVHFQSSTLLTHSWLEKVQVKFPTYLRFANLLVKLNNKMMRAGICIYIYARI